MPHSDAMDTLREAFGARLQENVNLGNYTTAHVGGNGTLVAVQDLEQLINAVKTIAGTGMPYKIIGSGANIVFSDSGYEGVIILNRAHNVRVGERDGQPVVVAESGANFTSMGRQTALRGFTGMEWAATIPGTVGGAIYGNAGAFGSDTQRTLIEAQVYDLDSGEATWPNERFDYAYRSSNIKRSRETRFIILSGTFALQPGDAKAAMAVIKELSARRKSSQPNGATMGSTFKNPAGDYAGRLIEAAGLKGAKAGDAQISELHANFIINNGEATAGDIYRLIRLAKETVAKKFGIELDLEIELIGEFPAL